MQTSDIMSSMIGQGDSEGLRRVEKDVLITKKVKDKAMKLCGDFVKGIMHIYVHVWYPFVRAEFENCVRGRTVSAAWKCREPNRKMKDCLTS